MFKITKNTLFYLSAVLFTLMLFSQPAISVTENSDQYHVSDDGQIVTFEPLAWAEIEPVLDKLIEETKADSSIEERIFKLDVKREDWPEYTKWLLASMSALKYPLSITARNRRTEGNTIDGIHDLYHVEVNVSNFALKEEDVRKEFVYKIFDGKIDGKKANIDTFYNLIARAEEQLRIREEFINDNIFKSAKNFQDKIYVKAITLKSKSLKEADIEAKKIA